jgi:cell division inhibitor SepF
MEEMSIQDKPGFFGRITGRWFAPVEEEEPVDETSAGNDRYLAVGATQIRQTYRYTVTVRRQITSFDDAMAAANGLKRGEQQIMNLTGTDPVTRQKIVDFMFGVCYAQEGTWEDIGEHMYLIVPPNAYVEMAPPTPRVQALRN